MQVIGVLGGIPRELPLDPVAAAASHVFPRRSTWHFEACSWVAAAAHDNECPNSSGKPRVMFGMLSRDPVVGYLADDIRNNRHLTLSCA